MMTLQEANTLGYAHGRAYFENMSEDFFRSTPREDVLMQADAAGRDYTLRIGKTSSSSEKVEKIRNAYVYNFRVGAMQFWSERRQQMPDVVAAERVEFFTRSLQRQIEDLAQRIANWKARFEQDPADAFEWSDDTMKAAAQLKVARIVEALFEKAADKNAAIDVIRKEALRKALEAARYPAHSTSQPSNITAAYLGVAWAEWARFEE